MRGNLCTLNYVWTGAPRQMRPRLHLLRIHAALRRLVPFQGRSSTATALSVAALAATSAATPALFQQFPRQVECGSAWYADEAFRIDLATAFVPLVHREPRGRRLDPLIEPLAAENGL